MHWIEPIWKMMWSNKALSAGGDYVRKPLLAREGANVTVVQNGSTLVETGGDYGEEGFVYQQLFALPDFDGNRPVLGSWIVDGEPAGMGIREGGLVTGNTGRFVPHVFK